MTLQSTNLPDLYIINAQSMSDDRGLFRKVYSKNIFDDHNLDFNFVESYYSISHRNVIRGMHFQLPPDDHQKLVYVPVGEINDVVLDIRKKSPTFGQHQVFHLTGENGLGILMGKGFAHGFESLMENTMVTYFQTSLYNSNSDSGVKYDSFGAVWHTNKPVLSQRDQQFVSFSDFDSPFFYET